jgi:hypothetical protein
MRRLPLLLFLPVLLCQEASKLTIAQQEAFLQKAAIQKTKGAKKGTTGTVRATLSDGTTTHDASIQTIDENKPKFETASGTEYNFQDSFKLNIAAYRLAKLLGLESMVPVSVERTYNGKNGSFTWWIDNVQMDEVDRLHKKLTAPDKDKWAKQFLIMKVFDNLIYNVDSNATNILYEKDWNLWMIDHTRSFRRQPSLMNAKSMEKCDQVLVQRIKQLKEADVKAETGRWLEPRQISSVMARAKLIVAHCEAGGSSKQYEYLSNP